MCNQDFEGTKFLLYYPDAGDSTGELDIYAYSPLDRWATVDFLTPRVSGNNRIDGEGFTRGYRPPAQLGIPSALRVYMRICSRVLNLLKTRCTAIPICFTKEQVGIIAFKVER